MMARVVFIVEGHKDADQVRGALGPDTHLVVTGGTKLNNTVKAYLEFYAEKGFDIYVLSDPDDAGEHLYQMILDGVGDIPRIHVDYDEAKYCKDLKKTKFKTGVEYCSYKYLRELLGPYLEESHEQQ